MHFFLCDFYNITRSKGSALHISVGLILTDTGFYRSYLSGCDVLSTRRLLDLYCTDIQGRGRQYSVIYTLNLRVYLSPRYYALLLHPLSTLSSNIRTAPVHLPLKTVLGIRKIPTYLNIQFRRTVSFLHPYNSAFRVPTLIDTFALFRNFPDRLPLCEYQFALSSTI